MSFQLSHLAVKQIAPLLLQGLCTREELIEYLATIDYTDSPEALAAREVDGYLILGERSIDVRLSGDMHVTKARLAHLAWVHKLRGGKGSRQKDSLALDAILTGQLVPSAGGLIPAKHAGKPGFTLADAVAILAEKHPAVPRKIYPSHVKGGGGGGGESEGEGETVYIVRLSNQALAGFMRYGHDNLGGVARIGRIITDLATNRFVLTEPGPYAVHPRHRRDVKVPPWVINHYASEGQRLGLTLATVGRGGVRTVLSVAGWTLELLGLGYLAPSHIIALGARKPLEIEAIP